MLLLYYNKLNPKTFRLLWVGVFSLEFNPIKIYLHILGYEGMYLPLNKVEDTPFRIQGCEVYTLKIQSVNVYLLYGKLWTSFKDMGTFSLSMQYRYKT